MTIEEVAYATRAWEVSVDVYVLFPAMEPKLIHADQSC